MKRTSRSLVALAALAVISPLIWVGGTAVLAAVGNSRGSSTQSIDTQKIAWRTGHKYVVATSQEHWQGLPVDESNCAPGASECSAFSPLAIRTRGDIAVTFSGNFTRAPVEIRARDSGVVMRPGITSFEPSSHSRSFSYTFVSKGKDTRCREVQMFWRSPTGEEVRMTRATLVVQYKEQEPRGTPCV